MCIAKNWKLHIDSAPAHTSFVVANYLTIAGVPMAPHHLYSRDVAPRLKTPIKSKHFGTADNIRGLHQGFKEQYFEDFSYLYPSVQVIFPDAELALLQQICQKFLIIYLRKPKQELWLSIVELVLISFCSLSNGFFRPLHQIDPKSLRNLVRSVWSNVLLCFILGNIAS